METDRGYLPALSPANYPGSIKQEWGAQREFKWHEMLRTPHFYVLWFIFYFGSLAGLMIIGQLSSIVLEQAGITLGFIFVAILDIFNAGGRIIGGVMYDKNWQNIYAHAYFCSSSP